MEEKGKPLFWIVLVVLVAISSFALGRISRVKEEKVPVRVVNEAAVIQSEPTYQGSSLVEGQVVVGSKNGTKYHLSTCPGAKQIAEKNLVTFASIEEARAKGYTPASNCPGLK